MIVVQIIATVVYWLLLIFFLAMWARFALDIMQILRRDWRPRGAGLVAAEAVYTVTDPPIRLFRRIFPPLRMGPVAFDVGWSLVMLLCVICMWIALRLA